MWELAPRRLEEVTLFNYLLGVVNFGILVQLVHKDNEVAILNQVVFAVLENAMLCHFLRLEKLHIVQERVGLKGWFHNYGVVI